MCPFLNNKLFSSPHLVRATAHQGGKEQKEAWMEGIKGMDGSCLTTKEFVCPGLFFHQALSGSNIHLA